MTLLRDAWSAARLTALCVRTPRPARRGPHAACKVLLAKFEDPSLCKPLAAEARTDLEALRKELGIDTPASWATCNGRPALAVE